MSGRDVRATGRRTFVVRVHPGGASVVENVRTRQRVRIELADLGQQIERWLSESGEPGDFASSRQPR